MLVVLGWAYIAIVITLNLFIQYIVAKVITKWPNFDLMYYTN